MTPERPVTTREGPEMTARTRQRSVVMRLARYLLPVVLVVCAGASFLATQAWQEAGAAVEPATPPEVRATVAALDRLLGLSEAQAQQVLAADPGFAAEQAALSAAVNEQREALASLLEDGEADADAVMVQLERVLAAQNALERRVTRHLLAVRPYLTEAQQRRLFQRCAQGVREAGGKGWRHGWGHGRGEAGQPGGEMRGPGRGMGQGRGRGGPAWRESGGETQPARGPGGG